MIMGCYLDAGHILYTHTYTCIHISIDISIDIQDICRSYIYIHKLGLLFREKKLIQNDPPCYLDITNTHIS
jgi:hypothetical protein